MRNQETSLDIGLEGILRANHQWNVFKLQESLKKLGKIPFFEITHFLYIKTQEKLWHPASHYKVF